MRVLLGSLRAQVPIFELTVERWSRLDHWDPDDFIDLSDEPFNLEYMDGAP